MELLPSLLSALKAQDPATLDQEYTRELGLTTEDGALKENIKKNRYKDILPYTDSDYINASFIKGASSDCRYIASQAPLSSTLTDFWRMIWQHDVKVIVMACREVEIGRKKCECYWSPVHQSAAFGTFSVCNQGETHPNEHVVIRDLTPNIPADHDVPYEAEGVLDLLQRARESQGTHTSPLLVHCSAGCGRTGVICALDYIHDLLVTKNLTADFSIMEIVLELRKQRPSSVQTKEQYQFISTTVAFMFERFLQQSAGEPHLYSNLTAV
ncbi:Tyrosine-protein phosphatase non-receptor type 18 [Dissostichus eleginoides]|uniref:protein-tyrosine-phosphatase n=1 Tax=Dissostichus eleginoides TaxID=100907 RepID=A0AAD9FE67_DISEL|nr:Tyrosine-protein phosphatase non-receptor type 18 [Dissostichus eleginoides]